MPRGGPRPNSGRKPQSLQARALRNARLPRPDGPLPDNVLTMPPPAPPPTAGLDDGWRPSAADLRSLGRKGKALTMQWIDIIVNTVKASLAPLQQRIADLEGTQADPAIEPIDRASIVARLKALRSARS